LQQSPIINVKNNVFPTHPWLNRNQIEEPINKIPPGSIVKVFDMKGVYLGSGFYNQHARVRLRWLTKQAEEPASLTLILNRLQKAIEFRDKVLSLNTSNNAYRLVNSEGDLLPGLIIDKYQDLFCIEFVSAGMFRFREDIFKFIQDKYPTAKLYFFSQKHIQKQESFDVRDCENHETIIRENGLSFKIQTSVEHKTGFYLDQRENRKKLATFCKGKSVLDLCCYTGGFSVYAKKMGEATRVVGIDKDAAAITLAKENASLNQCEVEFREDDLFKMQKSTSAEFDVVVLDPAKQTKNQEDISSALKRYYEMNRVALSHLKPQGVFVTCSCSSWIKEEEFIEVVSSAAQSLGRNIQLLEITGAGPDHLNLASFPEGRYLKVLWGIVT
jgi:23S rRNA (cytosine1962-C5)-methyltransferase